MNTTEQIILVILSTFLALFLLLAIAALISVIKLIKTIRDLAQKAEHVVTSAESVADLFRKASGPMTILNFVRGAADVISKHKDSRKEK